MIGLPNLCGAFAGGVMPQVDDCALPAYCSISGVFDETW
jgi:hypothetical protein